MSLIGTRFSPFSINSQDENKLWQIPVPSKYAGKPFAELAAHLRDKFGALLLAVVREEEGVKLEDILSDDSTSIDEFIKRKFEESGKDFFGAKKDISVIINPSDSYELGKLIRSSLFQNYEVRG